MGRDITNLPENHTMVAPDELGHGKENAAHILVYEALMGTQKCA